MTIGQLFISYAASVRLEEGTIESKRQALKHFIKVFGDLDASLVSPEHAQQYVVLMGKGRSEATVNQRLSCMKSYFQWLSDVGHIEKNPFRLIQSFRLEKKTPETYSEAEVRRMLTICECPYMRTAILLGFYCALRIGEAQNLQLVDIDWDRNEIHIRSKTDTELTWWWKPKNNSTRLLSMPTIVEQALTSLYDLLPHKQPYIMLMQRHYQANLRAKREGRLTCERRYRPWANFHRKFAQLLERADVKKKAFQDCRKTCGTDLAEAGVQPANLAEYMGHRNFQTTMNYYIRPNQQRIVEVNRQRQQKFYESEDS